MKKIMMIAVMAVVALTASAEKQPAGTFSLMPHLGFGYTALSNHDYSDDGIYGTIGGEAQYMFTGVFGLSLGLDYTYAQTLKKTVASADFRKIEPDFPLKAEAKTYYKSDIISIPLLAQVHFGHFAVKAGVQASFLLDPKCNLTLSGEMEGWNIGTSDKDYDADEVKKTQWFIPVGVSYECKIPLVIDLRANIPVTKLVDQNNYNLSSTLVGVTVGYRFDFGKK